MPTDLSVGDLDIDGLPDIAATNGGDGTVSILINQGSGVFAAGVVLPVGDLIVESAPIDNGEVGHSCSTTGPATGLLKPRWKLSSASSLNLWMMAPMSFHAGVEAFLYSGKGSRGINE